MPDTQTARERAKELAEKLLFGKLNKAELRELMALEKAGVISIDAHLAKLEKDTARGLIRKYLRSGSTISPGEQRKLASLGYGRFVVTPGFDGSSFELTDKAKPFRHNVLRAGVRLNKYKARQIVAELAEGKAPVGRLKKLERLGFAEPESYGGDLALNKKGRALLAEVRGGGVVTATLDPRESVVRGMFNRKMLENGITAELVAILREAHDDIVAQIARLDPTQGRKAARLKKLLASVDDTLKAAGAKQYGLARQKLAEIGVYEAKFAGSALELATQPGIAVNALGVNAMKSIIDTDPIQGVHLKEWFTSATDANARGVRRQIQLGLSQNETMPQIIKRVRGTEREVRRLAGGGEVAEAVRRAQAIARTAVNHISNAAHEEVYKQNTDVVKGYRYVATLDARTSDICIALDGQEWDLGDEGARWPPQHPNCRSTTVAIIDYKAAGLEPPPDGGRASAGGTVDSNTTYGDWLKGQDAKLQNEMLGPAKAQLFRDGKLNLKQLVDREGRSRTVAELDGLSAAATWKRGPLAFDSLDGFAEVADDIAAQYDSTVKNIGVGWNSGDLYLGELQRRQGFSGLPTVVNGAEFDRMLKSGSVHSESFRGLTNAKFSEAYRSGPHSPVSGHTGTARTPRARWRNASEYAGRDGTVMRMGLRKGARVIKSEELTDIWNALDYSGKLKPLMDKGRLATVLGYDAIDTKGSTMDRMWVILNRRAVVVQRADIKPWLERWD